MGVCVPLAVLADDAASPQTSLQQAANVTVTDYVSGDKNKEDKEKLDELLTAMMLAGLMPEEEEAEPDGLGDPEAGDDDENATRRNNRDRRRRNDQRRKDNRSRRQRNDDNNRTRNNRTRRTQRRVEDESSGPFGPLI